VTGPVAAPGPPAPGDSASGLGPAALADLAPLLRRALGLDPGAVVRLRLSDSAATALIRLPFAVLVGRTIAVAPEHRPASSAALPIGDRTVSAAQLLAWLDSERGGPVPEAREADWRGALPPLSGWRRVDAVPGDLVRDLVHRATQTLREAAEREGLPGATPRASVVEALLDTVVLTATADHAGAVVDAVTVAVQAPVQVTLRQLSAMTRMSFVLDSGELGIDTVGRWVRVASELGSAYAERPGLGLTMLR
jgi:hypothetical protein